MFTLVEIIRVKTYNNSTSNPTLNPTLLFQVPYRSNSNLNPTLDPKLLFTFLIETTLSPTLT